MSDTVIKVENISKRYRIGVKSKTRYTLYEAIADALKAPLRNFRQIRSMSRFEGTEDASVFWALKDINFEVKQGEVLGIIGHNGAGKSTLLKILSRITEPSSGKITMEGRLSALLEVGTGFHPDLTGRDNIYMNGTILGMTKREIDGKLDQIVDFSGVETYLDTPVKFYSSGMKVRLGFSVAAHLEPEILVVDEVLSVGDAQFQKKCLGKMHDAAESGRTVLFVSHDMSAVENLCHNAILLEKGKMVYRGFAKEVVNRYISGISNGLAPSSFPKNLGYMTVVSAEVKGQKEINLKIGEDFTIHIHYKLHDEDARFAQLKLQLFDEKHRPVASISNTFSAATYESLVQEGFVAISVKEPRLNVGKYVVSLIIRKFKNEVFETIPNALILNIVLSQADSFYKLPDHDFKHLLRSNWEVLNEVPVSKEPAVPAIL